MVFTPENPHRKTVSVPLFLPEPTSGFLPEPTTHFLPVPHLLPEPTTELGSTHKKAYTEWWCTRTPGSFPTRLRPSKHTHRMLVFTPEYPHRKTVLICQNPPFLPEPTTEFLPVPHLLPEPTLILLLFLIRILKRFGQRHRFRSHLIRLLWYYYAM